MSGHQPIPMAAETLKIRQYAMASTMLLNPLVCGTIERVNIKQNQVELL